MKKVQIKKVKWGEHKIDVVRISSVPGFRKWIMGQTCPLLNSEKDPTDWAYLSDYKQFVAGLPPLY